ncbi:toxD [Fusarium beomiforme]|uniref:ToxD n=1 Tax=Fusarium beomiforme TaxID=44412 RepID=A0A9P5AKI5_9HYPO|nr:toxD [Fusarium beomiforme]
MSSGFQPKQVTQYEASHLAELMGDVTGVVANFSLDLSRPFEPTDIIHDNACGPLTVSQVILKTPRPEGLHIDATDINPQFVQSAQQAAQDNKFPLKAQVMDARSLNFPDNHFTHSFNNFAFHSVEVARPSMKEVYRTLKPGGIAIVSAWNSMPHTDALKHAHWRTRGKDGSLPMLLQDMSFEEEHMKESLLEAGFDPSKTEIHHTDAYVTIKDIKRWAQLAWSYLGVLPTGWCETDEEKWEEAIDDIVEQLEDLEKDANGKTIMKFVACVAIATNQSVTPTNDTQFHYYGAIRWYKCSQELRQLGDIHPASLITQPQYNNIAITETKTMTTKAIVYVEKGKAQIQEVPKPKLRDDYILVKVNAVGLNPTDWKHVDFGLTKPGSGIGCDYAGIVEEVGPKVTKQFKKGDRISGVVHGADATQLENGGFAEYIVAKGDVQIKTPDNVTDEEAATLGISISTVGQGLYKTLGLPLPTEGKKSDEFILIYGGSTATGIYGIQFAKLSGLRVITTASPHNFDYLKSLGAEAVFDYKSPNVAEEIRKYTNNTLKLAWDCTGKGVAVSAGALSTEGGKYATLLQVDKQQLLDVNPKVDGPYVTLMYSIFGERFFKGQETPAQPEEFEFAKKFWEIARQLLEEGKLKAPQTFVNRGGSGFEGILKGLDELRANKVSGGKLVYTL